MLQLIIGLTAIVAAAWLAMYFGIRWQNRADDEPVEHGNDEP